MDSDRKDGPVGPNELALILKMLDGMQGTMEVGFSNVNSRLDKLNGRVASSESAIATLNERTDKMVCVSHAGILGQLESDVRTLKEAPAKSHTRASALTGTSVALVMVIAEGIWKWMGR